MRSTSDARRGGPARRQLRAADQLRVILKFQERSGALLASARLTNASEPAFVFRA